MELSECPQLSLPLTYPWVLLPAGSGGWCDSPGPKTGKGMATLGQLVSCTEVKCSFPALVSCQMCGGQRVARDISSVLLLTPDRLRQSALPLCGVGLTPRTLTYPRHSTPAHPPGWRVSQPGSMSKWEGAPMDTLCSAVAEPRSGHVLVFLVATPSPVTMSDPCSIFPSVVLHECEEQQCLFIHLAQNCV